MGQADIISIGGGIPDPVVFPIQAVAEASQRILGNPPAARTALQYSESAGYRPLRDWLAAYMGTLGVACGPDNILITSGSQQGLDLIGRLFLSPGDRVLIERPSYIGALRAFDACEASYGAIDELGDPGASPAKFAYLMPDFQNPLGTCLTFEERLALVNSAARRGVPLVEDSAYEKLRYDGDPVPPLAALDGTRVIYTSTFSKLIVPSLRVGWVAGPAEVIHRLTLLKQASDLHTSTFNQMLMLDLAERVLDSQIALVRNLYRGRRDATLAALQKHMPSHVLWTRPQGGMYLWINLPSGVDGAVFARRALAEERVAVVAGKSFYAFDPEPSTIRLAFPQTPDDRIDEGIGRLAGLLRRMLET